MEGKFSEVCRLLPNTFETMLSRMDTALTCDTQVNGAAKFRLNQCCSLFFLKKLAKTLEVSEQVLDFSWELLNTGHWKDVPDSSRVLYSFATLFKLLAIAGLQQECPEETQKEVCRLSDMALLMGAPILDGVFYKILQIFKPSSRKRKADDDFLEKVNKKPSEDLASRNRIRLRKENSISILSKPSLETFQIIMQKQEPVVIEGCLEHWPAFKTWSTEYLKQVAGYRTVPVEIGSKYTDDDWGQKLMTISQFVDDYVVNCRQSAKGYLAQHKLFDQVPELRDDICIPDYCSLASSPCDDPDDNVDINAWFGPSGTVSPCHHDPKHNLLAQVVGCKYIRLYHPKFSENLYPHGGASVLTNTSQVDVENPDPVKYPKFPEMDLLHCQEHLLTPGQMLYIPPKHWHYVRSLDVSFSLLNCVLESCQNSQANEFTAEV